MPRTSVGTRPQRPSESAWRPVMESSELPLEDEAHVAAWRSYEREARRRGVVPTLRRRLVQLRFPVHAGISGTTSYRRAVRSGAMPRFEVPEPAAFRCPEGLEIRLHRSPAGTLPVIRARDRCDFETLVRALTGHNEPIPVPLSMGACLVKDLNNWDRVRRHRRRWEQRLQGAPDPDAWKREFASLRRRRELYRDRLLLLSTGEYSGVGAEEVGLSPEEWRNRSNVLRLAHESAHYLVLRVFDRLPHRIVDELIADLAGIVEAFGRYSAVLARRFLGLEDFPRYRVGGRFENYCGDPVGSARFDRLAGLACDATTAIEKLASEVRAGDQVALGRLVIDLTTSSLERLAATLSGGFGEDRWGS